jgi:hypothetical protein
MNHLDTQVIVHYWIGLELEIKFVRKFIFHENFGELKNKISFSSSTSENYFKVVSLRIKSLLEGISSRNQTTFD